MPVPGPRAQDRPLPGYRNPGGEQPDRINLWDRPGPIADPGRTPATMFMSVRGNILAAGTVRRLWRQAANYIPAQAGYSWTANAPTPDRPIVIPRPFNITKAIRYMTRSLYVAGGTDNSRYVGMHSRIQPRVNHKPVSVGAGTVRNRPTVRNRLTSFGSRVTPLNTSSPSAQDS